MVINAVYRVIQLETAVTSDHPGYNQQLQPRNRDTVSSRAQIQRIALDIHPELLMESYTTDTGAPIVDHQLQVISGNGRTLSLLAAKGESIQRYFAAVRDFASRNGIEIPAGVDHPFLVRKICGHADLVKLAELSNRDNKLRRTDAEQAEADALTILNNNLLECFDPGEDGEIITASNLDFLNGFIFASGDESLRNSDGTISSSAEMRIKRAILACIFTGQKNSRILIQNLIEQATETGLKRQIDGVISAAGGILGITAHADYASYDLRDLLSAAFTDLLEFKKELAINPKLYKTVSDYLNQGDMFNSRRPAVVELMITFLAEAKSVKAIRENLTAYSETVSRIDPNTESMFGFADESREDILFRLLDPENRIEQRKESDQVPAVPKTEKTDFRQERQDVPERRKVSFFVPLATWDMLFVNVCVCA